MNKKRNKIFTLAIALMFISAAVLGMTITGVAADTAANGLRFVQVEHGLNHTLALTADGEIYGWGKNDYGQLALGTEVSGDRWLTSSIDSAATISDPTLIINSTRMNTDIVNVHANTTIKALLMDSYIVKIGCSDNTSYALTNKGLLLAWGDNALNQAGAGAAGADKIWGPRLVESGSLTAPIADFAAGTGHLIVSYKPVATFSLGGVGDNRYKQIINDAATGFNNINIVSGLNNTENSELFAAGNASFLVHKEISDTEIYSFGYNNDNNVLGRAGFTAAGAAPLDMTNASTKAAAKVTINTDILLPNASTLLSGADAVDSNYDSIAEYINGHLRTTSNRETGALGRSTMVRTVTGFGSEASMVMVGSGAGAEIYAWGDENTLPSDITDGKVDLGGIEQYVKQISMPKFTYTGTVKNVGQTGYGAIITEQGGAGRVYTWSGNGDLTEITNSFVGAAKLVKVSAGYNGKISVIDALGRLYNYDAANPGDVYPETKFLQSYNGSALADLTLAPAATDSYRAFTLNAIDKNGDGTLDSDGVYFSLQKGKSATGTFDTAVPMLNSGKGTKYKFMRPDNERAAGDHTGGVMYTGLGTGDNVTGKHSPGLTVSGLDLDGNNPFAFKFYKKTGAGAYDEQSMEAASKYFEIVYSETRTGATAKVHTGNADGITIKVIPRKRMPTDMSWRIDAWAGAYDQYGTNVDNKYYYSFIPVQFFLNGISNTELSIHNIHNDNDHSKELDKNDVTIESFDFTAFDINTAITHLLGASDFAVSADVSRPARHAAGYTYLGTDIDGDYIRFDSSYFVSNALNSVYYMRDGSTSDSTLTDFYDIRLYTGSVTLAVGTFNVSSPAAAADEITAWFNNIYKNPYGLKIANVLTNSDGAAAAAEKYYIVFNYEYLRATSKKTTNGTTGFTVKLLAGDSSNAGTANVFLSVKSTVKFAAYTGNADTKRNNYVGKYLDLNNLYSQNNFLTFTKTIGIKASTNFYVGERVSLNIDSLFKDATKMHFLPAESVYKNDSDLYEITVGDRNVEILAKGEAVFTFTVKVNNNEVNEKQDAVIYVTIKTPPADNSLKPKDITNNLSAETVVYPTNLFSAGYGEDGLDNKIIILSAISLTPSIANAGIVTQSGTTAVKIMPLTDGVARIRIKAIYYNIERTHEFEFRVTNLTHYSDKTLMVNDKIYFDLNTLSTKIAENNMDATDKDFGDFIKRLEPLFKEDGVTADMQFIDNESGVRTDSSEIVSAVYSKGSKQYLISADKDIMDYTKNRTVIYIKLIDPDPLKQNIYEISIIIQSNKIYLANKSEFVYKAGSEQIEINTGDFASYINALDTNIRIDFVMMGDIDDDNVSRGQRAVIESKTARTFTVKPLENGLQYITVVLYDEASETDPVTLKNPRYIITVLLEVTGITTVLTQKEYITIFAFSALGVFVLLLIIFLIRWIIYLKKRTEQKKLIKKNAMLIKMRDKMHQRPDQSTREQVLKTKLKMEDPKYTKMFEELKQEKTGGATLDQSGFSPDELGIIHDTSDKKGSKNKKKKKSNLDQMRAELEAKKARLATMQANDAPIMNDMMIELDDRAAIDEQIKAKIAKDGNNMFDFDADL